MVYIFNLFVPTKFSLRVKVMLTSKFELDLDSKPTVHLNGKKGEKKLYYFDSRNNGPKFTVIEWYWCSISLVVLFMPKQFSWQAVILEQF